MEKDITILENLREGMASEAVPEHRDSFQWKCSITSLGALIPS